ncbi:MAG: RNA polymerase sigma factor [Terrimicrobiaceae bacterium]
MRTQATIEEIARDSYGRLLAYLASRTGGFCAAEDALGDALLEGLRKWPEAGVPENPCGWLLAVAKRRLIDASRHEAIRRREEDKVVLLIEEVQTAELPDDRLKLLFVCAHPAIDIAARTPLMLQTILGLDGGRIASAFLSSPAAMHQRLVRAKSRIRAAGIPFRIPEPAEWPERVGFVLDAIYTAYSTGWDCAAEGGDCQLAGEAVFLARLLVRDLPSEPEGRGLLALMLHCEARRAARFSPDGAFVPLQKQDPALWDAAMINEAEFHLAEAVRSGRSGRYQLEAAIQSVHAARRHAPEINWRMIIGFYDALIVATDGIGAAIGRAAALAEAGEPPAALDALDRIPVQRVANHQPYWATRGHVLERCGRSTEALEAWQRSIGLTETPALREYLGTRATACRRPHQERD